MNIIEENFIVDLCDKAESIDDWLTVIKFGMAVLLEQQPLLAELIVRRAQKTATAAKQKHRHPSDEVVPLLRMLNLQLVVAPTEETNP